MDGKCKWYISVEIPECGEPAVDKVTHVPLRNGSVKKLDEPLPVCYIHKSHTDQLFAALRTKSRAS